jgi:hypothetical protein
MKNKVIITTINITRKGQIHHFQVKLPKTAKQIVAIELGGHLVSDKNTIAQPDSTLAFKRNTLIGDLKLQSCEKANIFYAANLLQDNNIGYQDFTQTAFWKPTSFTHQCKQFQDVVLINAESTIIQGIYKDNIGKAKQTDILYQVKVYVWYQK